MGQRLIISEEDRSRISQMYGLVNEQGSKIMYLSKPEDLIGKTVNFYADKENQNNPIVVLQQSKITGVDEDPTNNIFTVKPRSLGKPFDLRYNCERKDFTVYSSGAPIPNKKLYNKNLSDAVFKLYCSKNASGNDVQKADFASNDKGGDTSNIA